MSQSDEAAPPSRSIPWLTARPIAHRGYHDLPAGRPENSLAAFAAAIEANYAIECDLHPSSDGVPMVFHDRRLRRMTGRRGHVRGRSAAELARLPLQGTDERIPTLDEMLRLVDGRVPLVIELKHVAGRDVGFAAAVVDRLRRYAGPAALMSFDAALIADVKAAGPEVPRGLTAEGDIRTTLKHLSTIVGLGVNFVSYNVDHLPTAAPTIAQKVFRLPLISWTVQTPAQLRKAQQWSDQITFEGFAP